MFNLPADNDTGKLSVAGSTLYLSHISFTCARLRSYLGYAPVRAALPNPTHYALAALQYSAVVPRLVTQNVDGLHHKALSRVWDERKSREGILELHGTLHVSLPVKNGFCSHL